KRAVILPVSAPFHCALMAPAAEVMQAALAEVTLRPPVVPVIANVSATPVSDVDTIRANLVEQVTAMVRWRESIAWLAGAGVDTFVEVGSGRVLSGLARRIADGAVTMTAGSPDDIEEVAAKLGASGGKNV
ncbi:MAG: ACP S-malonyltransferase, partial [Bauldia litoralis]